MKYSATTIADPASVSLWTRTALWKLYGQRPTSAATSRWWRASGENRRARRTAKTTNGMNIASDATWTPTTGARMRVRSKNAWAAAAAR